MSMSEFQFPPRLDSTWLMPEQARSACAEQPRWQSGCGSKLNRRGYADSGPCFHLPGFHFGLMKRTNLKRTGRIGVFRSLQDLGLPNAFPVPGSAWGRPGVVPSRQRPKAPEARIPSWGVHIGGLLDKIEGFLFFW